MENSGLNGNVIENKIGYTLKAGMSVKIREL